MKITRHGHSMFLITSENGLQFLTDPFISGNGSVTPELKNPETYKKLDALLVTHAHRDHANGVADVVKVNPNVAVVSVNDLSYMLEAQGAKNMVRIDIGGTYRVKGVAITMVTAAHGSSWGADRAYAGLAVGFMIKLENGFKIYFAGDTGPSADMKIVIGDYFKPDLAIIPCSGTFAMEPDAAAYCAGELIRAPRVIPCHYFPRPEEAPDHEAMTAYAARSPAARASMGTAEEFQKQMKKYPKIETIILNIGQTYELKA